MSEGPRKILPRSRYALLAFGVILIGCIWMVSTREFPSERIRALVSKELTSGFTLRDLNDFLDERDFSALSDARIFPGSFEHPEWITAKETELYCWDRLRQAKSTQAISDIVCASQNIEGAVDNFAVGEVDWPGQAGTWVGRIFYEDYGSGYRGIELVLQNLEEDEK
ncbi:MAG: hypothetical protein GKR99_13620 [Rhodobacteraceae bacterium]|nr:hypothetical protein [Paracoccaceae bacterium]